MATPSIDDVFGSLIRMAERPYREGQASLTRDIGVVRDALATDPASLRQAVQNFPGTFIEGVSQYIPQLANTPGFRALTLEIAALDPLQATVHFDAAQPHPLRTEVLDATREDYIRIVCARNNMPLMAPALRSFLTSDMNGEEFRGNLATALQLAMTGRDGIDYDLMRAAIRRTTSGQDVTFTERNLSSIEREALDQFFKEAPEMQWLQQQPVGQRIYTGIPLLESEIRDRVTFDDDGVTPKEQRWLNALSSIGSGLANIRVERLPDTAEGTPAYVIKDFFDFERVSSTDPDSARSLALGALAVRDGRTAQDPTSTNRLTKLEQDGRNQMLGRIFAPERDDEGPTRQSLPIVIKVEPDGRGGGR